MINLIMDLNNNAFIIDGDPEPDALTARIFYDIDLTQSKFKNFEYEFFVSDLDGNVYSPEVLDFNEEGYRDEFPIYIVTHSYQGLTPDSEYVLNLSFRNRREVTEDTYSFKTPIPPKPYDSWVWSDDLKEWQAPLTPPDPVWDEESQAWVF